MHLSLFIVGLIAIHALPSFAELKKDSKICAKHLQDSRALKGDAKVTVEQQLKYLNYLADVASLLRLNCNDSDIIKLKKISDNDMQVLSRKIRDKCMQDRRDFGVCLDSMNSDATFYKKNLVDATTATGGAFDQQGRPASEDPQAYAICCWDCDDCGSNTPRKALTDEAMCINRKTRYFCDLNSQTGINYPQITKSHPSYQSAVEYCSIHDDSYLCKTRGQPKTKAEPQVTVPRSAPLK